LGAENYRPYDKIMLDTFASQNIKVQFYPNTFQIKDSTRCGWWAVWTVKLVESLQDKTPQSINSAIVRYVGKTAEAEDEKVIAGAFSNDDPQGGLNLSGLLHNRIGLKPKARAILAKEGDVPITEIRICRMPLRRAIRAIIKLFQTKEQRKQFAHDQLFHLFLFVRLQNGAKYLFEKNEDVNVTPWNITKVLSSRGVDIPRDTTLNGLLTRTIERVGEHEVFDYEATSRNCQKFVWDILSSSMQVGNDLKAFILQPVANLVPTWGKTLAYIATSASNRFNQVIEGKGVDEVFENLI
jgi:hypothetical protein